jgi:flagellar biosynthesis GTPase FlhF
MRTTHASVTVVRCDSPVHTDKALVPTFRTASIAQIARTQAALSKWARLPAWTVTKDDSPRRKCDLCPACAPAAAERLKNGYASERKAAREAAREVKKAHARADAETRATERAARAAKRAEAQAAKNARRAKREAWKVAQAERKAKRAETKAAHARTPTSPQTIAIDTETSSIHPGELVEVAIDTHPPEPPPTIAIVQTSPTPPAPRREPRPALYVKPRREGPSVLDMIARILAARGGPMTVGEIIGHAIGELTLPTQSKTPQTIVSRDLALDIKKHGDASRFERIAPGTFRLRKTPHVATNLAQGDERAVDR